MASRRMEKVARVIRESVSRTILTRLNDPRIQGLITVTEVEVAPDLKQATVFLSVIGVDEDRQKASFAAVRHAAGVIQSELGEAMTSRYVPHLRFERDEKMHKTLETLRLIELAETEWKNKEEESPADEPPREDGFEDEEQ